MNQDVAIILAAGKSKRMKTRKPKVLHELFGKPLIDYVIEAVEGAGISRIFMVVGYEMEKVKEHLGDRVTFVEQREQLGTGHAVQQVAPLLEGMEGDALILCGDMPLISKEILQDFMTFHKGGKGSVLSLLSTIMPWETDFGRIIRSGDGDVERIVEYRDATPEEKAVKEVNLSLYLFSISHLLAMLPRIGLPNAQKELYLTDTIYLTRRDGMAVQAHICPDAEASRGINSRRDLAELREIMRRRIIEAHMDNGVTFIDPSGCSVDPDVKIGMDTEIRPFTFIEKGTVIGEDCLIGPFSRLSGAIIGDRVTVNSSIVTGSSVGDDTSIGPYAYIRPDNRIGNHVKIGDFVELKKSTIGDSSKVPHLAYVGDATIGSRVNIGAGTITCNYDGVKKHPTFVDDGAHIGSNTNLVAPVKVGKNVVTGAGAVVTQDLPDNSVAVGVPAKVIKKLQEH
jgi:bifunctional UDP-N-acetylglucosamine pyrophosphorylase/glucosamine-1-phosphate N-acetyltransferase